MKKIFFLLLFTVVYLTVGAENMLCGYVKDEKGNALIGAAIYIPELQKGTVADEKGYYKMGKLPKSELNIVYSYIGYNTVVKNIDIREGKTVEDVSLSEAVIQTQAAVVTGEYVSSQHENVMSVNVLRAKDLDMEASPNIMEKLTTVPGVDMISKGDGIAKPVINGLSCNNVLVLKDGIRMENYQFSPDHPIEVNDAGLGHVEIIKGPASLLYGSDAIGGLINFVPAPPASDGKLRIKLKGQAFSNTIGGNSTIDVNAAKNHVFGGVSAKADRNKDYEQGGGDYVANTRFNQFNYKGFLGYTFSAGMFKVQYESFSQKLGIANPGSQKMVTSRGYDNDYWYQDLDHGLLSGNMILYLGSCKLTAKGGYQDALRKLYTKTDVPFIEMELKTYTYDAKLHIPFSEASNLILGAQGMYQENENLHNRASKFLPEAHDKSLGIVGMYQQKLTDALMFQGGLRYDWVNIDTKSLGNETDESYIGALERNYKHLSGSLGINYSPESPFNFRLNIAKAYRVPNINELTSNGLHGARVEYGNTKLDPQNSYEADGSIHYHAKYLSFDISGFYNRIEDYIYIASLGTTNADGNIEYQYQQTDAKLYGGDAGIHFHPAFAKWLHLKGTYSYVVGKQDNGKYLPFIPADKFRFEVRGVLPDSRWLTHNEVMVSSLAALKQDRPSKFETSTSGYTLFDYKMSTRLKINKQPLDLSFAVKNIFDKKYIDHLSTLKDMGLYNPGRNFILSVSIPVDIDI